MPAGATMYSRSFGYMVAGHAERLGGLRFRLVMS